LGFFGFWLLKSGSKIGEILAEKESKESNFQKPREKSEL
jgi:hypothetical protein